MALLGRIKTSIRPPRTLRCQSLRQILQLRKTSRNRLCKVYSRRPRKALRLCSRRLQSRRPLPRAFRQRLRSSNSRRLATLSRLNPVPQHPLRRKAQLGVRPRRLNRPQRALSQFPPPPQTLPHKSRTLSPQPCTRFRTRWPPRFRPRSLPMLFRTAGVPHPLRRSRPRWRLPLPRHRARHPLLRMGAQEQGLPAGSRPPAGAARNRGTPLLRARPPAARHRAAPHLSRTRRTPPR